MERPVCKMTGKSGNLLLATPADRRAEVPRSSMLAQGAALFPSTNGQEYSGPG